MTTPKVSIIIPTYNRRALLEECVSNILQQTIPAIEVIIVDDGSTDGTEAAIRSVFTDPRIRYIRKEKNEGAYAARNTGMELATGDFILHWDSDDLLYPYALEHLLRIIDARPTTDIVSAPARFLFQGYARSIPEQPSGPRSFEDIMRGSLPENAVILLVRKTKIGTIAFYAPHIDYTFYYRLARSCSWAHLNELLGDVRLAADELSETRKRQIPNIERSIQRARCLDNFLKDLGPSIRRHNPTRYGGICYGVAVGFLLASDVERAKHYGQEAKKYLPARLHRLFFFFTFFPFSSRILRWSFAIKKWIVLRKK